MKRGTVNPLYVPLTGAFRWAVTARGAAYGRGWLKTRRLNRPVVSVGNLAVGGTGKTPFVELLARLFLKRGWMPSILTRGYARRRGAWRRTLARGADVLPIEPGVGRRPAARQVGDEPALLARKLPTVPILVSTDRYRAGRVAEERFDVDVHILDDGFQHLALFREIDIVLLDVTQGLDDHALLPGGKFRETSSALGRAHFVVLTRAELQDPAPLENRVRQINPQARIFRGTTVFCGLTDLPGGAERVPEVLRDPRKNAASTFAGIGNPQAFFADLRRWGFSVVAETAFPDHHPYSVRDLDTLVASVRQTGAEVLLTTEKDVVNFPSGWRSELPVQACVVQTELSDPGAFEENLWARLETARVNA